MSTLKFSKMHGLGNDFMVINAIDQPVALPPAQIQQWADRQFGVGFDQLLLVEPAQSRDADFRYRIFNADGGEVDQCGNGARCFVKFVVDNQLTDKTTITVETASGLIYPSVQPDGLVSVDMGAPVLDPAKIPFVADAKLDVYVVDIADHGSVELGAVSMGNPHAVLLVDDIDMTPVEALGIQVQQNQRFPQQVNVGFMQIESTHAIKLRVYERGAGETLACGTGACAAVVSGIRRGFLANEVTVTVLGGELTIKWSGNEQDSVIMTGPAEHVFDGEINWSI